MTIRGRQNTIPDDSSARALDTARALLRQGRTDHERRDLARQILRAFRIDHPRDLSRRYDTIVVQRYLDLIHARIRAAGPPPRASLAGRGVVSLDLLAGADALARSLAAAGGGGR